MGLSAIEVKAFIAYYRELAERAAESIRGLPACTDVVSIRVLLGEHNLELVECPVHMGRDKEFAETVLLGIQNFCLKKAQDLETQLSAVVCR